METKWTDLDEYFCEKYANYDKLCLLPGYQMPKMQDSKIGDDGLTYAYTLPPETMRLAKQENKQDILREFKKRAFDQTFSFSFSVQSWFKRVGNLFRKKTSGKVLRALLTRHNLTEKTANDLLTIDEDVWHGIYKGTFLPTKNTVFSLALVAELSASEVDELFDACGYEWDFTLVKDTVLSYLIQNRIYNAEMIKRACEEYNVENLFIRSER
ncbi:MAG: hypothetical protein IJ996_01220 [Clostridia bacterium]|nr:hypothetical protein [Clostridia bacterium]